MNGGRSKNRRHGRGPGRRGGGGRGRGRGNGQRRLVGRWRADDRCVTASADFRRDVIHSPTPHYPDHPAKTGDETATLPSQANRPAASRERPAPNVPPAAPAVLIDEDRCVGCGMCVDTCPVGAITMDDGIPVVGDECIACGLCAEQCPNNAITLVRERV